MADKLDLESKDLIAEKLEQLQKLFPNLVTEGPNGKVLDLDQLKNEFSKEVVEGTKERYRLEWPGKKEAIVTANLPTTKTLRPVKEDSVDFDNTENLYIEGDNLEVLKILQESYFGKIKMIYIDPPYNTGKDFVYKDNFSKDAQEELEESGQKDEYNQRLFQNADTSGRYHSDWLSMMYPRLKLARNLLTTDGVIFISIDDNESHNLRKVCDEIFGMDNLVSQICHKARASISNDKVISSNHNTILWYARDFSKIFESRKQIGLAPNLENFSNPDGDPRGDYRLTPVDGPGGESKGNPYYEFMGVEGFFRFSKKTMEEKFADGLIVKTPKGLQQKYFRSKAVNSRRTDNTWWDDAGLTSTATRNLKDLMGGKSFDTPKPVELIYKMLTLTTFLSKDSIILDFFSGSATTAHACMQLNAEDQGKRKHILVQLPEACDEKSEAFKAGYKNICEIGKERIRRAASKIVNDELLMINELKAKLEGEDDVFKKKELEDKIKHSELKIKHLDTGFRVYRLDSSNMADVYHTPQDYDQKDLERFSDNVKPDRMADDLLAQIMLDWGLPLSLPIEEATIAGKRVFHVAGNSLLACFDTEIDEDFAKEVAKEEPLRIVFKDAGFTSDTAKSNVKQLLRQLSPETEFRVI